MRPSLAKRSTSIWIPLLLSLCIVCIVARLAAFRMPAHLSRMFTAHPTAGQALECNPSPEDDSSPTKWRMAKRARDSQPSPTSAAETALSAGFAAVGDPRNESVPFPRLSVPLSADCKRPERPPKA